MRILFVVTNVGVVESYGPMYLSAIARQKGHQTRFVRFRPAALQRAVAEFKPDVMAWSAFSGEFQAMAASNDQLKRSHRFVSVFGGYHPTYFPEALFRHDIDYGVVGEGEEAFAELLEAIGGGGTGRPIPNVITRDNPVTEVRPLLPDLDALPFPDYEGYYAMDGWLRDFPVKMFVPSRGCPYNCAYCFNHKFHEMYKGKGAIIRRYSVDRVIEEIAHVKARYPLEFVRFNDDCFTMKRDRWIEDFCQRFPARIGLPFFCVMNPHFVSDDTIAMLKEAGLKSIFMSIEHGDEEYRRKIMQRLITNERLENAFAILRRHGINVLSSSLLALPGMSFADDLKTLALNQRCRPTCPVATIFQPYPKLALTQIAIDAGAYSPTAENDDFPTTLFAESQLNFPPQVKKKQKNLSDAFILLARSPRLARLAVPLLGVRLLILPWVLLSTALNAYLLQTKIYPHKLTPRRLWLNLKASIQYFGRTLKGE